jgi:outer membrane protein assembly factor BamB
MSLDARTGRIQWRKKLPSRSESSPLVLGRTVYFGSENGTVYALDARTGRKRWTYHADGAVKSALAYDGGKLYFGDYGDHFQAISVRNGHRIWRTGGLGQELGRGGRFYGTPAVAFGRVYAGNYDGRVYSFSARSGKIAWTRDTGNYVLAAPAVADVPGTKPSVYIGSTTGDFFALDARSGDTRWKKSFGGRIMGPATIVDDVVYFANERKKSTTGLKVTNGRRVFKYGRGGYNPVISDGRRLFLTGYSSVYAFNGREVRSDQRKAKRAARAARRKRR